VRHDKKLSELASMFKPTPQELLSFKVPKKLPLEELKRSSEAIAAVEKALGGDGRVVVRYSGTEKKARVMVEGPDPAGIKRDAETIRDAMLEELAA
jgi:phosphoglucosamine mutase